MVVRRLLLKGKQADTAAALDTACFEHEIEGPDVVRWIVAMSLVGREFLRRHNGGKVSEYFGPLGPDGKRLSAKVFGDILKVVGQTYFRTGNMTLNAIRTCQDTLAAQHLLELGWDKGCYALLELARQQRTSPKVSRVVYGQVPCHELNRSCLLFISPRNMTI